MRFEDNNGGGYRVEIRYRIMKLPDGDEDKYGLFECFVGEHGILFWTETAELYGDDLETMKLEIDLMQQAFELPILDYDDGKLLKE